MLVYINDSAAPRARVPRRAPRMLGYAGMLGS